MEDLVKEDLGIADVENEDRENIKEGVRQSIAAKDLVVIVEQKLIR